MANPNSMLNVLNGTEPLPAVSPIVAITTLAVTRALHCGKTVLWSLLASFTSTLPAATGSGDIYRFMVGIVTTSGGGYVLATDGTAVFKGVLWLTALASVGASNVFGTTTLKNITLNATTTGGLTIGDWIQVQDIATNVWAVQGTLSGSGTLATPFS